MAEPAETPFEDESVAGDEAAVDAAIRAAGGAREAVRALLVDLAEARALAVSLSSLGYRRGRQPLRRLP
ncbi:hypothetical protein IHQ68_03385 [Chelatococcus sambhunathii]|uniref:Uncharacterized protein n=1 Tax=Chelatococcus sambhunathii TaxID=363953 RepID=A0ABU1DC68_9HYPH|nr:hypothetical protein [Chelatococcus sambhunathii]MDR4305665.1 hypothetical protein [Chelatococcus sambhunathii]